MIPFADAPVPSVLILLLASPLAAYDRGDVLLENTASSSFEPTVPLYDFWQLRPGLDDHATASGGVLLIWKFVPYTGAGHFIATASNQFVFHHDNTVARWNGEYQDFNAPGSPYIDLFHDDAELSEIAPMRSGRFLVAERSAAASRGAKLIEFDLNGVVAEYTLPSNIIDGQAIGARHIEVLADQCTVLYTTGSDDPDGYRVRRFDICTSAAMNDFASLLPGQYAGSIRRLPDGNVLVANGTAILEFSQVGSLTRSYEFAGVTNLAIASDAQSFWAAGVRDGAAELRQYIIAGAKSFPLGNPGMQSSLVAVGVSDLVIVGEWRVATAGSRFRAVRR